MFQRILTMHNNRGKQEEQIMEFTGNKSVITPEGVFIIEIDVHVVYLP